MASLVLLKRRPSSPMSGLPADDVREVEVQLYLAISGLPYRCIEYAYPSVAGTTELPAIRWDIDITKTPEECVPYLQENFLDLDEKRNRDEISEIVAYKALIEADLIRAEKYFQFADLATYSKYTRLLYAPFAPFPLNRYLPYSKRQQVLMDPKFTITQAKAFELAEKVYEALSVRLGIRKTFFGGLSTLDVKVAAHVAIAVHFIPQLRGLLDKKHKNLIKMSTSVIARYFAHYTAVSTDTVDATPSKAPEPLRDLELVPAPKRFPPRRSELPVHDVGGNFDVVPENHELVEQERRAEADAKRLQRTNIVIISTVLALLVGYATYLRGHAAAA